jgi:hypothetical protein
MCDVCRTSLCRRGAVIVVTIVVVGRRRNRSMRYSPAAQHSAAVSCVGNHETP